MWPIITTSALGIACSRKLPGQKFYSPRNPVGLRVLFEDWTYLRQIKTNSLDVRIGKRSLCNQVALGGSDIQGVPRKSAWDSLVGALAHSSYCAQRSIGERR